MKSFRIVLPLLLLISFSRCGTSSSDQKKAESVVKQYIWQNLDSSLYSPLKFSDLQAVNIEKLTSFKERQLLLDSSNNPENHTAEDMAELRNEVKNELGAFSHSYFLQHSYVQRSSATTNGETYHSDSLVADRLFILNQNLTTVINDFYPEKYGFKKLSQ